MTVWAPRPAEPSEFPPLARVWHDAWMEVHADHVPAELTRLRTIDSFIERLAGFGDALRTAGPTGAPLGLCLIREDEMHQLFTAPSTRGTGLGARLIGNAESRLAENGVTEAWLDVVEENHGARRFYARQGWRDRGVEIATLDTSDGPFRIRAMVMEKRLFPST